MERMKAFMKNSQDGYKTSCMCSFIKDAKIITTIKYKRGSVAQAIVNCEGMEITLRHASIN